MPLYRDEDDFPETGQGPESRTFSSRLGAVEEAGTTYLKIMSAAERAFHLFLATYSDAVSPVETEDDRESRYLKRIYDDFIDTAKSLEVLPKS